MKWKRLLETLKTGLKTDGKKVVTATSLNCRTCSWISASVGFATGWTGATAATGGVRRPGVKTKEVGKQTSSELLQSSNETNWESVENHIKLKLIPKFPLQELQVKAKLFGSLKFLQLTKHCSAKWCQVAVPRTRALGNETRSWCISRSFCRSILLHSASGLGFCSTWSWNGLCPDNISPERCRRHSPRVNVGVCCCTLYSGIKSLEAWWTQVCANKSLEKCH